MSEETNPENSYWIVIHLCNPTDKNEDSMRH